MNLDEAARLVATWKLSEYRYWKNKIVLAYMRGHLPLEPTKSELMIWISSYGSRHRVTIYFDTEVYKKLQEYSAGKYGKMSDFVNKVVREAL